MRRREILAAGAWDRRQLLERLRDSAVFLADWMVHLARHVLDQAAEDSEILPGHTVTHPTFATAKSTETSAAPSAVVV